MTAACASSDPNERRRLTALFDSTDVRDHRVAAELCVACPMLRECRRRLREALDASRGAGSSGGPQGTWAGLLIGAPGGGALPGVPYEIRQARAAYVRGNRSEWAVVGNRSYERARLAARRADSLISKGSEARTVPLVWENEGGPERCVNTSDPALDPHNLVERKC